MPGKGEGVYAPRLPFINVMNVTHGNETIYYILYTKPFFLYCINISCLKRPQTPQKPTYTPLFIRCRKEYLHFWQKRPKRQINILTDYRKTKHNTEAKPPQHAAHVRNHCKTTSGSGKEATQRSTRKKHTQKRGNVYKILFLVRMCVRVLSWGKCRPTSQIYLNISTFYHRPAVSVARSCVCACACVRA